MMRIWFVIFKISENLWQGFLPLEAEATGSSFTAASDLGDGVWGSGRISELLFLGFFVYKKNKST